MLMLTMSLTRLSNTCAEPMTIQTLNLTLTLTLPPQNYMLNIVWLFWRLRISIHKTVSGRITAIYYSDKLFSVSNKKMRKLT